ncbi:MAG: DNA polymerase III subunit gamma/tau, partial [Victivallales bacterium]
RNLCDEVMYAPMNSRYKVYIIDEVHMLSPSAWNALLKTVEEPPAHVKFLFATTEAHKVLPTIVSRCQRFDLRRISTKLISDSLQNIAAVEKVKISRTAIAAISRAADGGMRDAQSLLDQMISFFSSDDAEITEENVLSVFGLTGESEMENLVSAVLNNDRTAVVSIIHSLSSRGKNLEKLFDDLLFCLRGVELCKILPDPATVLETGEESVAHYRELGKNMELRKIEKILELLSPAGRILHDAMNKQVFIESIILKAMRYSHAVQIEELISKLNSLSTGGALNIPDTAVPTIPQAEKKNLFVAKPPEAKPQIARENTSSYDAPEIIAVNAPPVKPSPTIPPAPPPAVIPPPAAAPIPHRPPAPIQAPVQETPRKPAPAVQPPTDNFKPDELWHKIIAEIDHAAKPMLKTYMQECIPGKWENGILTVFFDQEFEEEHASAIIKDLHTIENCLHRVTKGRHYSVKIEKKPGIVSPHEQPRYNRDLADVKAKVRGNKYVQAVIELYDGEIVDVRG